MTPILAGIVASGISGHLNPFTPTGSYDALATYTVPSGGVSNITFAGLPTGGQYTHLQIRGIVRTNRGDYQDVVMARFNDDTGSNYSWHYLGGDGSSAVAGSGTSASQPWTALVSGNSTGSNTFGTAVIDILDFSRNDKNKTIRTLSGVDNNSADGRMYYFSNLWMNTSAINKINLAPIYGTSFNEYTQFSLYGVRG